MKTIGLFGGTFDPIHVGHVQMAKELKQRCALDEMRLLPCNLPPHKDMTQRTSQQRLDMVALALQDEPELSVDACELQRDVLSYTIDTVQAMRAEVGNEVALCWCVGMDSLVTIGSWYRWRELLDFVHLLVVARPGWELPQQGEVADWFEQHLGSVDDLKRLPNRRVVVETLSLVDVSSTGLREQLQWRHLEQNSELSERLRGQLPAGVYDYIEREKLYD